jgi:hypothetical protein
MKRLVCVVPILALFAVVGCSPSQKITSSWKNPQVTTTPQYKKLFITALVPNPGYRSIIERDIAAAAESRGLKTISSMDIFPATFTKESAPTKEEVLKKVVAAGADAILTVALVDKASETRYVPGTTVYTPYMGYGGYGAYGGFGGYYGYAYGSMYSTPGYYTEDKTYFMEARLFDAASENMIWSAQSEAYNPSKIDKFSKDYTAMLVERMQRDFGVKK